MRVYERMTPHPVVTTVDTPVAEAAQLISDNHFRRLPVMDKNGKLMGIITEKELQKAMPSQATSLSAHELNYILMKTTVGDILPKRKLITIDADELLEEAAVLMRNHKIGAVPVTKNEDLVGIITETNIFDAFIDIMGLKVPGYRITATVNGNPPGILGKIATIIGQCGGNISHVTVRVSEKDQSRMTLRVNREADIDKIVEELEKLNVSVIYETV